LVGGRRLGPMNKMTNLPFFHWFGVTTPLPALTSSTPMQALISSAAFSLHFLLDGLLTARDVGLCLGGPRGLALARLGDPGLGELFGVSPGLLLILNDRSQLLEGQIIQIDFSIDMSYLQNQLQHKNMIRLVKTVFLYYVSIRGNLSFKLQKLDQGDITSNYLLL